VVTAVMRAQREQAVAPEQERRPSLPPAHDAVGRLDAATSPQVTKILTAQPDWAIALVLAMHPWQWAQAFLSEHTQERVRALRALALDLECVKPAVRSALLRVLVDQLEPPAPESPASHNFDAALERAMDRLAMPELRAHRALDRL